MEQMKMIAHTTQMMIGPSSPDIGKKLLKAVMSSLIRRTKMINPKTAIIALKIPFIMAFSFFAALSSPFGITIILRCENFLLFLSPKSLFLELPENI